MIDLIGGLVEYRYLLLFLVVVAEGPVATLATGWLAAMGQLDFLLAYPVIVSGDLGGDLLYYALGRFGRGSFFIERFGNQLGLSLEKIHRLEHHFDRNGGRTLILGKLLHGIGGAFLVAAGAAKMPVGRFFYYNLIATLPKSLLLMLIGYYYGWALSRIESWLNVISVISLSLGLFLIWRFLSKRQPL